MKPLGPVACHRGQVRRFGNLVDVAWDRDVRLIVLADGPRQQILQADLTDHERMTSRLQLLQTA